MKKLFLFLLLILLVVAVQPAQATSISVTGYITDIQNAALATPFNIAVGDSVPWTATWPTGSPDGWVQATALQIDIGNHTYDETKDANALAGYPQLLLSSGDVIGVDFMQTNIQFSGYNGYYHISTVTPNNSDYMTFDIVWSLNAFPSSPAGWPSGGIDTTQVASGVLTPIPAPILLLGTGLLGLAGLRRKKRLG